MTAQYEWRDETDLGHPSLVYLDISNVSDSYLVPFSEVLEESTILKVKHIQSFDDVFNRGRLNLRKVRAPKGMEFVWHHRVMNTDYYALFVAFRQKNTARYCSEY